MSRINSYALYAKLPSDEYHRTSLMISQHAADLCHHMVSLVHTKFTNPTNSGNLHVSICFNVLSHRKMINTYTLLRFVLSCSVQFVTVHICYCFIYHIVLKFMLWFWFGRWIKRSKHWVFSVEWQTNLDTTFIWFITGEKLWIFRCGMLRWCFCTDTSGHVSQMRCIAVANNSTYSNQIWWHLWKLCLCYKTWVGVTETVSSFCFCWKFTTHCLSVISHVLVWQLSLQLGCGWSCQIWVSNRYNVIWKHIRLMSLTD